MKRVCFQALVSLCLREGEGHLDYTQSIDYVLDIVKEVIVRVYDSEQMCSKRKRNLGKELFVREN